MVHETLIKRGAYSIGCGLRLNNRPVGCNSIILFFLVRPLDWKIIGFVIARKHTHCIFSTARIYRKIIQSSYDSLFTYF